MVQAKPALKLWYHPDGSRSAANRNEISQRRHSTEYLLIDGTSRQNTLMYNAIQYLGALVLSVALRLR